MNDAHIKVVHDTALIQAPMERLWVLSTEVKLVQKTLGMRLVGGVTEGRIGDGSRVVWKGWKFGLPTEHHTLITGYAAPHPAVAEPSLNLELHAGALGQPVAWFQDSQEKGRFATFHHDHWFREQTGPAGVVTTTLEDEVHFSLPFGGLGALVAQWVMVPYVKRLVKRRFASLKALAEGEGWRQWV